MIDVIYVAAPWKHRETARAVAIQFREAGFTVMSRWHDEWGAEIGPEDSKDPMVLAAEANADFADVILSEAMVVLNIEKSEGKAVEQGIAHTVEMPIVVIGTERFNVFQYLPRVRLVPDFDAAVAYLRSLD